MTGLVRMPVSRPLVLTATYASNFANERNGLWNVLKYAYNQDLPLLVIGDYNMIIIENKKKGGRLLVSQKVRRSFIIEAELYDLGFTRLAFTWCNEQQGSARIWERLDRTMYTVG